MRTDSPRTSETIPKHDDPMTDPTRLRETCLHRDVVASDEMSGWHCVRCGLAFVSIDVARKLVEDYAARVALATPAPGPSTEADDAEDHGDGYLTATPDPAPDVEAAWKALASDPDRFDSPATSLARHRPIIEAAIRARLRDTPSPEEENK